MDAKAFDHFTGEYDVVLMVFLTFGSMNTLFVMLWMWEYILGGFNRFYNI